MQAIRNKFSLFLFTIGTAVISTSYQSAIAQEARLLEEVVVTASKRLENQQDVPISISAFSGEALKELGLGQSSDLAQFVPGLEIGTASGEGSQLAVFLRGAGLNDLNTNNAGPIGMYADEVYISSPILTAFQLFDLERVEVLKGPQGTLYGRNTTGGAIKFISNKPTDELSLDLRAAYGSYDRKEIELAVSGPLTDNMRARAAISQIESDGWLDNLYTDSEENGVDTRSWRGTLDADLTNAVFMRVNLHGSDVDQPSNKFNHFGTGPEGADVLGYSGPDDLYKGNYNRDGYADIDTTGGYLHFEADMGGLRLVSVTAYDEVQSLIEEETDSSPLDLIFIDYGIESETLSQELRLEGSTEKTEWLAGVFYLDEELNQNQSVDLFRSLRPLIGGGSDPSGDVFGAPILLMRVNNEQLLETWAAFSQVDYAVDDQLTLTVGLRYTDESRKFSARGQLEDELIFVPNPAPLYSFKDLELNDSAVSWRVGADYVLDNDIMIYGSIANGFKSGGFNGGFLSLNPIDAEKQVQPYDPEYLTAYELGIKSELFDGKLRLNAALFFNDFDDLQVFTIVNTDTLPVQVLDNASSGEAYGLEFDALWYPSDSLMFSLTGTLLDSELSDFVSNAGDNFSGNDIARTPKASLTLLIRYDYSLSSGASIDAQTSVAYKADQFFTTENSPLLEEDAYTLVNARIGYQSSSEVWGVSLFANNLFNKEYRTNATDLSDFGFINYYPATPRAYGIELEINL